MPRRLVGKGCCDKAKIQPVERDSVCTSTYWGYGLVLIVVILRHCIGWDRAVAGMENATGEKFPRATGKTADDDDDDEGEDEHENENEHEDDGDDGNKTLNTCGDKTPGA
jgi:hypothetical protein